VSVGDADTPDVDDAFAVCTVSSLVATLLGDADTADVDDAFTDRPFRGLAPLLSTARQAMSQSDPNNMPDVHIQWQAIHNLTSVPQQTPR